MPFPYPAFSRGAAVPREEPDEQRRQARELVYFAALLHVTPEELRSAVQESAVSCAELPAQGEPRR